MSVMGVFNIEYSEMPLRFLKGSCNIRDLICIYSAEFRPFNHSKVKPY